MSFNLELKAFLRLDMNAKSEGALGRYINRCSLWSIDEPEKRMSGISSMALMRSKLEALTLFFKGLSTLFI